MKPSALLLKASLKGEACRRLADTAENQFRKALWIERAHHWDQLAAEIANQMVQRQKARES
jgi:hypothetical protein